MKVLSKAFWLRMWTYFRRAHGTYLGFLLSLANFLVIQYNFLVGSVPFLSTIFSSLASFTVCFSILYIPLCILIGWMDYEKGAMPTDLALSNMANPWTKDLAKALLLLSEGKNEEARKILKKWS